jgi:hypothetical protein
MKKYISIVSSLLIATFLFSYQTFAAQTISISIGSAYYKSNNTYNLTVKDTPNTKLTLYTNDKNPINAIVNKSDWATFYKVKLSNNTKLSFTKSISQNGESIKKAINYTRYVSLNGNTVSFSTVDLTVVAAKAKAAATAKAEADAAAQKVAQAAVNAQAAAEAQAASAAANCTNGTYVNSAGNTVCSPETTSTIPSGATAQCVDGTYSFSKSRSGTCSHHGGVASWL